jgi:hypothetical protein
MSSQKLLREKCTKKNFWLEECIIMLAGESSRNESELVMMTDWSSGLLGRLYYSRKVRLSLSFRKVRQSGGLSLSLSTHSHYYPAR